MIVYTESAIFKVRRESLTGPIVKFAKVGEPVFHQWECDGGKNCF